MNLSLFSHIPESNHKKIIHNHDGILEYQTNYISDSLSEITKGIIWRDDKISMFGKIHSLPRLTAWHGDLGIEHTYSRIKMISPGWTPALLTIKNKLQLDFKLQFNSVLINYYRDGNDHMSYHSDDEAELGLNPTVASISIGETRKFHLKHRYDKSLPTEIFELESQSLLIMREELQHFWLHKISKSTKVLGPRLNLTFRLIK